MCDHSPNREAAMVIIDNHVGVWCDPCLEPLIRALNDSGIRTVASCCGHGHRPGSIALEDGRWLFIATEAQRQVIDGAFPEDINGERLPTRHLALAWRRGFDDYLRHGDDAINPWDEDGLIAGGSAS
jgi:hypothetical protein